jgi:protein-L-isoaspartate O-methyltransferase
MRNARENGQISPVTTVRAARAADSRPHLTFVLQEHRKSANIHASLGIIWRIPVKDAKSRADYVLGHADPEIERLQFQSRLIAGVTLRLIRECGIGPGMRVLEIGRGFGDVSMLRADTVGASGVVVAIDREQRAIETARARAARAGQR